MLAELPTVMTVVPRAYPAVHVVGVRRIVFGDADRADADGGGQADIRCCSR